MRCQRFRNHRSDQRKQNSTRFKLEIINSRETLFILVLHVTSHDVTVITSHTGWNKTIREDSY